MKKILNLKYLKILPSKNDYLYAFEDLSYCHQTDLKDCLTAELASHKKGFSYEMNIEFTTLYFPWND